MARCAQQRTCVRASHKGVRGTHLRERCEDVRGVLLDGPAAVATEPAVVVGGEGAVHLEGARVVALHEAPQRRGGGHGADKGRDEHRARRKVPARRRGRSGMAARAC